MFRKHKLLAADDGNQNHSGSELESRFYRIGDACLVITLTDYQSIYYRLDRVLFVLIELKFLGKVMDFPVNPHDRDTIDKMRGTWIIEIAELEWSRKPEGEAIKAFLSRRCDKDRLAYGRMSMEYPRQSIFVATKNPGPDGTYLKDDTGNRRWWPVRN